MNKTNFNLSMCKILNTKQYQYTMQLLVGYSSGEEVCKIKKYYIVKRELALWKYFEEQEADTASEKSIVDVREYKTQNACNNQFRKLVQEAKQNGSYDSCYDYT